jgi:ATP-dependent Clp endopeptidase proteolytic subunit ClpP
MPFLCVKLKFLTMKIYLYGEITSYNENSAKAFLERFNAAQASGETVDLHVHCVGGEVIEGNMIYNAVKNARVDVNIYVDGLAASMGSVILMAGKKVYMSENAFVMTHAPGGAVRGTAEDMTKYAKLLRSIEQQFVKVYMARTGKSEKEVKGWLAGNNWFSAGEALALGIADGIVDKVTDSVEANLDTKNIDMDTMYGHYAALLTTNKNNSMNKTELIARFGLSGLNEKSSDEEVMNAVQAKVLAAEARAAMLESEKKEAEKKAVEAVVDTAIADQRSLWKTLKH